MDRRDDDVRVPSLSSSHVNLREIVPNDYPFLYHLAVGTPDSFRWRFRDAQPSYEEFTSGALRSRIFCHFLVESRNPRRAVGYVACYQADFRNRHAYIGVQGVPAYRDSGMLFDAMKVLLDFLFGCYEFDKIYAECAEFNVPLFASALETLFIKEGHLRNHERFGGQTWDMFVLACYRETWFRESQNRRRGSGDLLKVDEFGRRAAFEEFRDLIAKEFELNQSDLRESTRLCDDLGFDSLKMLELVLFIEENADVLIEDSELLNIGTLGEAHCAYIQAPEGNHSGTP